MEWEEVPQKSGGDRKDEGTRNCHLKTTFLPWVGHKFLPAGNDFLPHTSALLWPGVFNSPHPGEFSVPVVEGGSSQKINLGFAGAPRVSFIPSWLDSSKTRSSQWSHITFPSCFSGNFEMKNSKNPKVFFFILRSLALNKEWGVSGAELALGDNCGVSEAGQCRNFVHKLLLVTSGNFLSHPHTALLDLLRNSS